jgi:Chromo (CHRromatin Organisation MOdifier) domain
MQKRPSASVLGMKRSICLRPRNAGADETQSLDTDANPGDPFRSGNNAAGTRKIRCSAEFQAPPKGRFSLPEVIPNPGPREKQYVVDRLVDAQMKDMGQILYQVRWLGYDPVEDTWEGNDELQIHFIRRYWRTKGLSTLEGVNPLY